MENHQTEQRHLLRTEKQLMPNFTRPVWESQQATCKECRFRDQDIDTFPCAKCHTRSEFQHHH